MLNKFLSIFGIIFLIVAFTSICYATGNVVMDLNNTVDNSTTIDNTTIGATENIENEDLSNTYAPSEEDVSVSTDYDVSNSDELSISNIINIILIVVGIVLILLGIAIILKLK